MLEFGVEVAERLEDVVLAVSKSFSRCPCDFGSNSGETSEVADPLDTDFISEVQALEWNPFVRVNDLEERESIQLGALGRIGDFIKIIVQLARSLGSLSIILIVAIILGLASSGVESWSSTIGSRTRKTIIACCGKSIIVTVRERGCSSWDVVIASRISLDVVQWSSGLVGIIPMVWCSSTIVGFRSGGSKYFDIFIGLFLPSKRRNWTTEHAANPLEYPPWGTEDGRGNDVGPVSELEEYQTKGDEAGLDGPEDYPKRDAGSSTTGTTDDHESDDGS